MCLAVIKFGGQCAGCGVAPAVCKFGLQNARGAGTDENTHAMRGVFFDGVAHGIGELILLQSEKREPVVAAVKVRQMRGQLHVIHARDLAGVRGEIDRIKGAGRESATPLSQRGQRSVESPADTTGGGEMRQQQGI